jgi:hypothetical protein
MNGKVMCCPRNAHSDKRAIGSHKLRSAVGGQVHAAVGVPIQLEVERQSNRRNAVVAMTASVGCACHDGIGTTGDRVLVTRASCS